ncbi:diguanylate cyclase [Caldalkalibacillus mannanilyticus]|uniref:diguanylate cyclase n=1 Tax=Caldalkalibacillus mannanilyticus TaxID=1418 RepID=UPI00046A60E6|nr:diguanylate cyclase [Caldalkalibacillus mannanilyticus]
MNLNPNPSILLLVALITGLFIMAFYHFCLFLFRRTDHSNLFFSILCLLIGLISLFTHENKGTVTASGIYIETWFTSQLGFLIHYSYINLLIFLCLYCYLLFMYSLFPEDVSRQGLKLLGILLLGVFVFLCFYRLDPFTSYYHWIVDDGLISLLTLIISAYIIVIYVKVIMRKRDIALFAMSGFAFLLIVTIHDIVLTFGLSPFRSMLVYGMFACTMIQSLAISYRFSRAFQKVEDLSVRLLSLDKLKDEFLANTSHELRTPLHGIIGMSESLMDGAAGKLPDKAVNQLQMVVNSGKRLENLIDDILDFSKLKNQDIVLREQMVDIKQLTSVIMTISKTLLAEKQLTLVNQIPDHLALVKGDENRIQQIMYNLIGNSIKYTEKGTIRVTALEQGEYVQLNVSDTGIGIPKEKFHSIFRSFEQVDASTSREYGGAGLGLSITKQLIELQGGEIWLESEEGKGSTFSFTLPLAVLTDEEANPVQYTALETANRSISRGEEIPSAKGEGYRILVVDDEEVNRQILINHLTNEHYTVVTAENGIQALSIIEEQPDFDLVLMDVMMPKMQGYELCRRLRKAYTLYELPILLLTAKQFPQDIGTGFQSGANDYVSKPFDKVELLARTRTLISLKHAVQSAIQHAQHLESEIQQRKIAEKIQKVGSTLSATLDIPKIIELLVSGLTDSIAFDHAYVFLQQKSKLPLSSFYKELPLGDGKVAQKMIEIIQIHENKPINQRVLAEYGLLDSYAFLHRVRGILVVPFVFQERLIGFILLSNQRASYTDKEINIVHAFATQTGIALQNAYLFEEIKNLATKDGLTGLLNRRYFYEEANKIFDQYKETKKQVFAMMLDIDKFKAVNDTYGHLIGDQVLCAVAEVMTEVMSGTGLIARYGGEEFVILIDSLSEQELRNRAEELRLSIEQLTITSELGQDVRCTISIGISSNQGIASLHQLLDRADQMLYEAKSRGRNRVVYDRESS